MRYVRGILERLMLVVAIVVGGLAPGYIAQYRLLAADPLHPAWQGGVFRQFGHLLIHARLNTLRATFGHWVPTFSLTFQGVLFALVFAAVMWLLFLAAWAGVRRWRSGGGKRKWPRSPPGPRLGI